MMMQKRPSIVNPLLGLLIAWPERVALLFSWAGPLFARLAVGYVLMMTGWAKLQNLPDMIENFRDWGIPYPELMTPFVSGVECFGGLFLMLGFLTRISGGALAVVMLVAIGSVKWEDVDSLYTLLGYEETAYMALFFWLAVAGGGACSLDHWLARYMRFGRRG